MCLFQHALQDAPLAEKVLSAMIAAVSMHHRLPLLRIRVEVSLSFLPAS